MTRRRVAAVVLACALVGIAALPAAAASKAPASRRLLVVSLPHVEWDDVDPAVTPNLWRFLRASAVGGLITPGIRRPTTLGDAYLTFGAGARLTGEPQDLVVGEGRGVDEPYGETTAGAAYTLRTGRAADEGLVYLPVVNVRRSNEASRITGEVGLLGQALARAGITTGVIANGDRVGDEPAVGPRARRDAVAALMDRAGRVPTGVVDDGLLEPDRDAPSNVRLDADAVLDAFTSVWQDRAVVLVEASDLVRAEDVARNATVHERDEARRRALRSSDALLGRLLDEVDPATDTVLVVAPVPPAVDPGLTVVGLRGRGIEPGLLGSATVRRTGFVNLVDLAPTILDRLGVDEPRAIEGNRMRVEDTGADFAARRAALVRANADGRFRDDHVGIAQTVLVLFGAALAIGVVRWHRRGRSGGAPVVWLARAVIGFLLATALAAPLRFADHGGAWAFWTFSLVVGAAIAFALERLATRTGAHEALVAAGAIVVVHLADLVSGARLELDAVFGYSPTVGIRVAGQGNLTFAQVTAAALVVACLVVGRRGAFGGWRIAAAVLALVFVVMGSPWWGQDFGAVVVSAPAFAVFLWLASGRSLRRVHVAALGVLLVASGVAVGLLDLLRPPDDRTHVGRFFDKLLHDPDSAAAVVRRKAAASLGSVDGTVLFLLVPIVVGLFVWWWRVPDSPLRALVERVPSAPAALAALVAAAGLGFALNDSGVAIPAMMLVVLESFVVVAVVGER